MATATPVSGSDGQYTADLQITQGGTYEVLVTMENASTDADSEISTIVSVGTLTLVITDVTTVPSASRVKNSPSGDQIESGKKAIYKFRSRSEDKTFQPITTDNWMLTLTCQTTARCGDETYTYTATTTNIDG